MKRSGRCLCGAVRLSAEVAATTHGACHCGMCRRWCGGAPFFFTSVSDLTFEGEENLNRFASSDWAERGSCKKCGTPLFYFFKPAKIYSVGVGAFDEASEFQLNEEIFIDDKPTGYALAGEHPRLTQAEVLAKFGAKPLG
jgi:hypothetical protein